VDASPALIIRFADDTTAAVRDRLVALLAEHSLVAIQEDDLHAPRVWTAHFADDVSRAAARSALAALTDSGIRVEAADVEDEDWARRTQADLPAVRIGRFVIAPPWDLPSRESPVASLDPSVASSEIVIEIEPSRGFGTGHHQSTRLCLVLLQARDLAGRTAIDVGTGSGVLAIAAAKLGAAYVSAIDVDPDAIENARENIERNGAGNVVEAHVRDLTEAALAPADVVTANLTGTLLARHAADLGTLVKPGGASIVAGFTSNEREMVAAAFASGFAVSETAEEDGWWAFVLTRGEWSDGQTLPLPHSR
jgi:ribosomal protein L11 methyltransferase